MDGNEWADLGKVEDLTAANAQAEVKRLAGLDRAAYESERKDAAARMGWRASVLDAEVNRHRPQDHDDDSGGDGGLETLTPWPDAVDGASLAEEIRDRLRAHVVFSTAADADAATLWIFGSYLMDVWRLWPRLLITSPTKACGKSTLLEVIDAMAHRGLVLANASPAVIYRAIEAWAPTLLMDECDTWMKQNEELAGILNSGHTRRTANVLRTVDTKGELVPAKFSTWCPMVIAGIGSQRDTLMSRSIVIGLRRRLPEESVDRLPFDLHERLLRIRRQARRWADDHHMTLGSMDTEPPDCGDDRRRDNYTPLWRIAALLGAPWPDRIAAAYVSRSASDDDEPTNIMILRDVWSLFEQNEHQRTRTSAELVEHLVAMDDRPWPEYRHGRPVSASTVARMLRPFGVKSLNIRAGMSVVKGYQRDDVKAAFDRYAAPPAFQPLHRYKSDNIAENGDTNRYTGDECSGLEAGKDTQKQSCSGVAAENPPVVDPEVHNPDAWR